MAETVESKIINGLMERFGALTLPDGVTVSYPNLGFEPSASAYVRLTVLMNDPVNRHIGGGQEPERMGLFQASVFWPAGQGAVQATELAGSIRSHFAFNTTIDHDGIRIWVVEEPTVGGAIQEPSWVQVPVTVPWHVYP